MIEEALEQRNSVRKAFVWLYVNGYEKNVEWFLYDIQILIQETAFANFETPSNLRLKKFKDAFTKLQHLDRIYFDVWNEHFIPFCSFKDHTQMSNLIRDTVICLIWDFRCVFWEKEEVQQAPIFHADKEKIRKGVILLYENGYGREVEYVIWLVKRVLDMAISQSYNQNFSKNNSCIHRICFKMYQMNKSLFTITGTHYFRICNPDSYKDKCTFAGEIAVALLWDKI